MIRTQVPLLAAVLAACASAREITFPPVYGIQVPLQGIDTAVTPGLDLDISHATFAGLSTFGNIPYVHCLAAETDKVEPFDIAILGAPFDTGVTARPGARYGPKGIRSGSGRLHPEFSWRVYSGKNSFQQGFKVVDCGDAPLTFLDNTVALKQLTQSHKVISSRKTNNSEYATPRIITIGGDHTTTLPALRSTFDHWGPVSVIHFDSHIDTWRPDVLGGGISHYAGVNHGTFLHIAHEEGLLLNTSIHAGIRAPVSDPHGDLRNDRHCGFSIVRARDIDRIGVSGVVSALRERVKGTKVYISVDIDVLDPAYAPATGTPEVGGWTTRELLAVLEGLEGTEIVGGDVVEVSPVSDGEWIRCGFRKQPDLKMDLR